MGPWFLQPHSKKKNAFLLVAFFNKHGYCYCGYNPLGIHYILILEINLSNFEDDRLGKFIVPNTSPFPTAAPSHCETQHIYSTPPPLQFLKCSYIYLRYISTHRFLSSGIALRDNLVLMEKHRVLNMAINFLIINLINFHLHPHVFLS